MDRRLKIKFTKVKLNTKKVITRQKGTRIVLIEMIVNDNLKNLG